MIYTVIFICIIAIVGFSWLVASLFDRYFPTKYRITRQKDEYIVEKTKENSFGWVREFVNMEIPYTVKESGFPEYRLDWKFKTSFDDIEEAEAALKQHIAWHKEYIRLWAAYKKKVRKERRYYK